MALFKLDTLVPFVRERSPFFRKLYRAVPATGWKLQDLPIVDYDEYWAANVFEKSEVWTGPFDGGHIASTSGTTGVPNVCPYSREEWHTMNEQMGRMMAASRLLEPGQRVANLCAIGNLFSSFYLIHDAIKVSPVRCIELPLSSKMTPSLDVAAFERFRPSAVLALMARFINIAGELLRQGKGPADYVRRAIFGGEIMSDDQCEFIRRMYPNAKVCGVIYATLEAALLGYWDDTCAAQELRAWDECAIVEIVDSSGKPIEETGQAGQIIATSLIKSLMPAIRHPTGDLGAWTGAPGPNRKFELRGRVKPKRLQLADQNVNAEELKSAVVDLPGILVLGVALVIDRSSRGERVTIKLPHVPRQAGASVDARAIEETVRRRLRALIELERTGAIAELRVELHPPVVDVDWSDKSSQIIDRRGITEERW